MIDRENADFETGEEFAVYADDFHVWESGDVTVIDFAAKQPTPPEQEDRPFYIHVARIRMPRRRFTELLERISLSQIQLHEALGRTPFPEFSPEDVEGVIGLTRETKADEDE